MTPSSSALKGEEVTHILVTHCHADHSPLAAWLRDETGAPTLAFGPHGAVDPTDKVVVEEAIDTAFHPDERLAGGAVVGGDGWTIEAVHTPGHTSNHLCYALREERALFSGDHVMGWSTTVIAPPDGDMRDYLASLRLLLDRDDAVYWPTHGGPITDPSPFVHAYLAHRLEREQQVLGCVRRGVGRIPDIVAELYIDVPAELHLAAGRSVLAHWSSWSTTVWSRVTGRRRSTRRSAHDGAGQSVEVPASGGAAGTTGSSSPWSSRNGG